jgi:hypothetical protein
MSKSRRELKEIGWTKGRELAKLARAEGQWLDCAPWVHTSTNVSSTIRRFSSMVRYCRSGSAPVWSLTVMSSWLAWRCPSPLQLDTIHMCVHKEQGCSAPHSLSRRRQAVGTRIKQRSDSEPFLPPCNCGGKYTIFDKHQRIVLPALLGAIACKRTREGISRLQEAESTISVQCF